MVDPSDRQRVRFTRKRLALGIGLIIAGFVLMDRLFYWRGLQESFENKPFFVSVAFAVGVFITLGFGVIAGIRMKMFLKPLLIVALWVFLFMLPIMFLPFSVEVVVLIIAFSWLAFALLGAYWQKWHTKQKREENT